MPSNYHNSWQQTSMWGKMIIKSVSGKIITSTEHKTMRQTLEWCALEGVDLSGADLRKARLSHASLDGLRARGACFWGADFTASDIGFADLREADMRCAILKDACLAETDLSGADLQGAYFSGTIVEDTHFENAALSCPSFWDCDLQSAAGIKGLVYNHLGETKITLSSLPLVLKGFPKRLVLADRHCIWGNDLFDAGALPLDAQRALFEAKTALERTMRGDCSHSAKKPIRKILPRIRGF